MLKHGYSSQQLACLLSHELIDRDLELLANTEKGSAEYLKIQGQLEAVLQKSTAAITSALKKENIRKVYKRVDTCAAEFESFTPYLYSSYEDECESDVTTNEKVIILGGGPNRIGQGIEFDYCCCHCSFALQSMGYESIMVNSNPETVSTDYDTSNQLYFEPLVIEDILNIYEKEKEKGDLKGVILQFGGQTPLKLARALQSNGVNILGTSPADIDRAEDREQFSSMIKKLKLRHPEGGMAASIEQALNEAQKIGYPVLARPSYVLGGRRALK